MPDAPTDCSDCRNDIEHCHGTLVLHLDGEAVCSEGDCFVDFSAHAWIGSCWDVVDGCACGTPLEPAARRAA